MAEGNVRGTNWGKAVNWAKQGKYGKAKQQVELGGGTWSTEMHKSLKATGDYKPPVASKPPPTETPDPAEELQGQIDSLLDQLNKQQANQAAQTAAYNQEQARLAAERERMRPKDASRAFGSTLLSGGDFWNQRKKNWLQPFSSLTPGGN